MRSSSQIQQEIERRLGFFPPFFEPALTSPDVLENLWQQTLSAYLDNPFSALFKEKLNALLSRYCLIPYCMICHSASLRPLGMTAAEVLKLLESPDYAEGGFTGTLLPLLDCSPQPASDPASPEPGSSYEQALIACATHLYLKTDAAEQARPALLRLLGPELYQHFIAYLAYIETCHLWMESHPEISYEADRRVKANLPALLDAEPALLAFFQDYQLRFAIQQSSRAARLRRSRDERRFRAAFENAAVGIAIINLQGQFTEVNPAYERLTGYAADELLETDYRAIVHSDDHPEADSQVQRLLAGEIENFLIDNRTARKDGAVIWTRSNVSLVSDAAGQTAEIMAVVQDITEQRRDAELAAEASRRVVNILESITDAVCTFDHEWRFTYLNPQAERLLRRPKSELLGQNMWEAVPVSEDSLAFTEYHRAVDEQVPVVFEAYYVPLAGWFEIHAFPSADGLSVYFHDISARKEVELGRQQAAQEVRASEERYRLLVEGARDYAMLITDPEGIITYINPGAERIFGWTETELLGRDASVIFTREDQAAGVPAREMERARVGGVTDDIRWHRRENGTLFWANGTLRSLYDDSGNLRGYAKVIRDATEQKMAQDELEALYALNSSVLESIDDAFYAVDTNWCFTYVNSRAARWFNRPSRQLVGRSLWEMFPAAQENEVSSKLQDAMGGSEPITFEGISLMHGVWLEISAFPMPGGLTIYFRDISERHEMQAAQDALLTHEQNIATQLQQALQPAIPDSVPGLAIANYYKAALDEAGVGGDFYDIFPVGDHRTALIVGDLSGKGLAAAAQVSTVRNMLRYALYNNETLADAVTRLNRTLAENHLLTGFATLFVGCYDASERALHYVNCAQEPTLLVRAAAIAARSADDAWPEIEELRPTGTVLGTFEDAQFEQRAVTLQSGDIVAVFTDGLTEAGPNRREMLDNEGVARLLLNAVTASTARPPAVESNPAPEIAVRLIGSVDAYAGEGMRDDVCLLIAVAQG